MVRRNDNTINAFFALVRAGLWGKEVRLSPFGTIEFSAIQQLAEEQSVVGLVAAGLEKITDVKPAKKDVLQFIGQTLQIEQRNQAMNYFIGVIVEKMREAGIYTTLVKGQGVAQCYEKPQWRSSGDVDFFLDEENYRKAQKFLAPLAAHVDGEDTFRLHQGMTIDPWVVELHGTMYTEISGRVNKVIEEVQRDVFQNGGVRVWNNDGVEVQLPSPDNDVIIVFTHFLQHFFVGGVGLRQICDWCRLLWVYREEIDLTLLEQRLREMGIMSEWRAFYALATKYLGLPEAVSGFMFQDSSSSKWEKKADRIMAFVLDAGNFGHNKDNSYRSKYPRIVEKSITFFRRLGEYARLFAIFPLDAPKFFVTYVRRRLKATVGE